MGMDLGHNGKYNKQWDSSGHVVKWIATLKTRHTEPALERERGIHTNASVISAGRAPDKTCKLASSGLQHGPSVSGSPSSGKEASSCFAVHSCNNIIIRI